MRSSFGWRCRIVVEGKLSVTTAALHLCDVELIGPLRPRSFAPGVGYQHMSTLPSLRVRALRVITCEQIDPCSRYSYSQMLKCNNVNQRNWHTMTNGAAFYPCNWGLEPNELAVSCFTVNMSMTTHVTVCYRAVPFDILYRCQLMCMRVCIHMHQLFVQGDTAKMPYRFVFQMPNEMQLTCPQNVFQNGPPE